MKSGGGVLIMVLMVLPLWNCTWKSTVVESSMEPPEWVVRGSAAFNDGDKGVFYGVGAVTGIHNKPLARTTSENRARAEIAKIFETYTASLMKDYAASTAGGGALTSKSETAEEQSVEQTIKTFSSATLSGVMIVDRWIDASDGTVYALARLDLERFKNTLETTQELNAHLRDYVKANAKRAFDDLAREEEKH